MKTQYEIKDKVWIHIGERKLVEGRVVEIIDLEHLKEGHDPEQELYIIELKTGIEDIYEVRSFDQISPDAKGPINAYRKNKDYALKGQRFLNKIGIKLPVDGPDPLVELAREINEDLQDREDDDPTPEQIHAAMAAAEQGPTTIYQPVAKKKFTKPRSKKPYNRRKKPDANT